MKQTAMWNEIQDQPEVAKKVLDAYMPKADYFRNLLLGKKQLILTGMGASLHACQMAKYIFLKYSNLMPQIIPSDELTYLLEAITEDTLVIFISQSGESYETKEVGKMLKEKEIEFWGITNDPGSSLAKTASEVMLLHCGKEISSATKTNMASLLILCTIAAGYDQQVREVILQIPELLRQSLDQTKNWAEETADFLILADNAYILGLGANAATAMEGALMMQEKTFIHTGGTSASDFRHGTVEVTSPGLPIILAASGAENRTMAENHAQYFYNIGAHVFFLTDTKLVEDINIANKEAKVPYCPIEELSPLLFLMPMQLLAEATARKKGLDVDGFRYLSKVVAEYSRGE